MPTAKSEAEVIKLLGTLLVEANKVASQDKSHGTGACVYTAGSGTYCADLTQNQCDTLGGIWTQGGTCP
jgi:hypothetical protein